MVENVEVVMVYRKSHQVMCVNYDWLHLCCIALSVQNTVVAPCFTNDMCNFEGLSPSFDTAQGDPLDTGNICCGGTSTMASFTQSGICMTCKCYMY